MGILQDYTAHTASTHPQAYSLKLTYVILIYLVIWRGQNRWNICKTLKRSSRRHRNLRAVAEK